MILGAPLPIPLLYPGINVAGYSWRDSSCPGPGHHKEPGWTVHCCPPQEGQHPLLGPFLPTCLSLPESCLEALAPEQTQRLHQCCLPGHAAPPLTDQILSGLRIGPIWTQSHGQQSVSTSQQRHLQSGVSCRENSPHYFPRCPIHLWLLSGASRVRSRRFPCPRRSCPRRATKTDQTLNWVEEHKGDRTSEHSWPPGTWSSAPTPMLRCYLFPLVPCHFSICKCLLRAAPYL